MSEFIKMNDKGGRLLHCTRSIPHCTRSEPHCTRSEPHCTRSTLIAIWPILQYLSHLPLIYDRQHQSYYCKMDG